MYAANRNELWAKVFVEELARSGLRAVCIAPGSRSTPLVMAFAQHPDIKVYSHIDERSAAFFALGLALASDRPVALLCSSGTATANFHPAIIEAFYSRVPLLILTADRAHELRESGANQTIDQVKMYGDHVLWSTDVALPESNPAAVTLRYLRTLACRVYAMSMGLMQSAARGPVHLNFPFRKPLEPTPVEDDMHDVPADALARPDGKPFTSFVRGEMKLSRKQMNELIKMTRGIKRGIIICGPRCPGGEFPNTVDVLSSLTGWVLLADPLSGVYRGTNVSNAISNHDSWIRLAQEWEHPEFVLQIGSMPTSQALDDYLNAVQPKYRVLISEDGFWSDANHRADLFIHADPLTVCNALANNSRGGDRNWYSRFADVDMAVNRMNHTPVPDDAYFDGAVLRDVVENLSEPSQLFVASSLPVRHLEQFAPLYGNKQIDIYANRGASGIDGTVSSALGVAAANPHLPTVLVTGDLAFYHDLNGLLAVKRMGVKAIFVVINNDGGGIFHRLPIANFDPIFTDLFVTPHGLTFEAAAQMYGLDYALANDHTSFHDAFQKALASDKAVIIEVPTNAEHDAQRRKEIMSRIAEQVKAITTENSQRD